MQRKDRMNWKAALSLYGKRILIVLVCIVAIAALCILLFADSEPESYADKYAGVDLESDIGDIVRENTYGQYLEQYPNAGYPDTAVPVDLHALTESEGASFKTHEGQEVLYTQETSKVTWEITVPQAGLYNIYVEYFHEESRSIDAERALYINGKLPFQNAEFIAFSRFWTDASQVRQDNQGNDIRPSQKEVFQKGAVRLIDTTTGYEAAPYKFYFEQGVNTVSFVGMNEPLLIAAISLEPVKEAVPYEQYYAQLSEQLAGKQLNTPDNDWSMILQGEAANLRSAPSLYAINDRSSSNTVPYSVSQIKLNAIGGNAWRVAGQWIQWEIEVPADGWYNIAIKGKQNYERGKKSSRLLTIDGQTPFRETEDIGFQYSNAWEIIPLGDGEQDYCIYLEKGKHTLRLEVTLGDLGASLSKLEDSVYRLNQIYRQLLVVMGRKPDKYRDYQITNTYPDMADAMLLESQRLYQILDEIVEYSGGKSSKTGTILSLARLLEEFAEDPNTAIQSKLSVFRDYISAIGTTIQSMSESKLDIDYIVIKETDARWPDDKENFFGKIGHEISSLWASFFVDYDSVGNVYQDDEDVLEVWILAGRDQSNALKTMIDDDFTANTGIKVNLKLVESGAVLGAVVAGDGPDILLSAGQSEPVNYALRNAVEDLSQFEDFEQVIGQFTESAYMPYMYDGGVYALPETQNFSVLFYREDILDDLGLEVPETWQELVDMLPTLQHNNMEIGLPDVMSKNSTDLSAFYSIMYQKGVPLYTEEGYANLDQEGAIEAFEYYVTFYTNHDQPKEYAFADRFRSGEMPIGIASFSLYNTLAVFAPELKGMWSFGLIPGTVQEDGTINHTSYSSGACSMMLKTDNEKTKQNAWEFMKWWAGTETQTRFGREMESILGASGRYATANVEAFSNLAWSQKELEILQAQRAQTQSNHEVPGGYYTTRQVINAIRKVVNDSEVPRETLLDYNQAINDEITKKRKEFGLD